MSAVLDMPLDEKPTGNTPLLIDLATLGLEGPATPDTHARYIAVIIQRDAVEHVSACVFEHELPILRAVHGDSAIEDARVVSTFVPISADIEYSRLEQLYGEQRPDQSYVDGAYGPSFQGRLKSTLDEIHKAAAGAAVQEGALGTAVTVSALQEGDPLLDGALGCKVPHRVRKKTKLELASALAQVGVQMDPDETAKADLLDAYAVNIQKIE